jgi:hypothetical protein
MMLSLGSARWAELSHAFGSAEDIPRLLEALADMDGERERAELWFGVAATLAPEGRTVSAAYAAVPHLLRIGEARGAAEQVTSLHVAATIEMNRHLAGAPPIPEDLVHAYADAIESLPARVCALVTPPWDDGTARIMAAALLAGKHHPAVARTLLEGTEA